MLKNFLKNFIFLCVVLSARPGHCEVPETKLGYIGCLTSFAGSYGTAVLEGAQLAAKELNASGANIKIYVEDDQSEAKNTVSAYSKLVNLYGVQALIGGSWWVNAIVSQSERAGVPLVSCETLYNQETVLGKNYFLMQGDLNDWVRVYEPLVKQHNFKTAAVVRYASGFGATLAEAMKELFSKDGRKFVGAIEYNDIQIPDAAAIALQLKKLNPDVIYIDAQPAGLVTMLKRLRESSMQGRVIFTNSIAEDVIRGKLLDLSEFKNIYYTKRSSFDRQFAQKFEAEYKKPPYLNADLGYYSVFLAAQALKEKDSIGALKSGLHAQGREFAFNENNVYSGPPQEVWTVERGQSAKVYPLQ